MKKFLLLFIGILYLGLSSLLAQTVQISGAVISADDGLPLPGVTVMVKGTLQGTVTNADGQYSMAVSENAVLQYSFVGMITQEIAVAGRQIIDVEMNSGTHQLEEVVVTALGITREKKALGYSVQDVKADELVEAGQKNVLNALSGKVSGLQVTSQGGQIGASQNIVIRGNSSFGNNQPLFVINGIPVTNDNSTGSTINLGSGINDINPTDIESIAVLKGGSAALYGMRAGNGVILINTKQGRKEKGVVVSYDGDFTVDNVYGLPKFQNKYGQGYYASEFDYKDALEDEYMYSGVHRPFVGSYQDFANEYGYGYFDGYGSGVNDNADESWGPRLDTGLMLPQFNSPVVNGVRQATPWVSHPNNVKDFFVPGYSTGHTISLASTSENTIARASVGYRDQTGTTPNTNLKRYSASINNQYMVNQYIDFDISATYTRTTSDNLPGTGYESTNPAQSLLQWFGRQVDMKALKDNWDEKDEYGDYTLYNWQHEYHMNPYYVAYRNTTTYKRDRTFGKASLWFKPTDWLKFEGRLGMDFFSSDQLTRRENDIDYPEGYFRDYSRHTMEFNADFIGYFSKRFSDFNLDIMAGANFRDYDYALKSIGGDALIARGLYTVTNINGSPLATESHSRRRSNSLYANASLGWKNQLYIDLSARNDWDSTIDDPFFYPSVSGSWIITETFPALAQSDWLNFAKLRGGWATIGNATEPYRNGSYYRPEATGMYGVGLVSNPFIYPPGGLKPEMIKTWEIGFETYFIQNRIRLDAAYYRKTTTDQIMEVNVANSSGFNSMVINAGKLTNKGVEIQLNAGILRNSNGLNWSATLNWAKDKSKIDELMPGLDTYQLGSSWGCRNYAIPGKTWGTLRGTGFVYNDDGSVMTEDGFIVFDDDLDIGDVTPKWLAGLHNEFSYRGWSLGFLLDFRKGGDIYSLSQSFGSYTGIYNYTAAGDIRENGVILGKNVMKDKVFKDEDGRVNDEAVNAQDFFYSFYDICQLAVIDGSYLKLREAHLTYTFPKAALTKTRFISGAKISLIGNNLALLWTHKSNLIGLDSESTTESGNRGVGFESNTYPPARSIGIKLGLTF